MTDNFLKRAALWIAMLTPLITLIAVQGKPFFEALSALPTFIAAFAAVLPLGTRSLLLAVLLAAGTYYWLERWTPQQRITVKGRDFFAELAALLMCPTMTVLQLTLADQGPSKGSDLLVAISLGLIGGWMAPFITKLIFLKAKQP